MKHALLVSVVSLLGAGSFVQSLAQDAARSSGWVVIPIRDYDVLRSKAYPVVREAEVPTPEATLTRIDYDLRVDGAVAAGRANLTIDVLKDGWVRVPVPQGLLVREARIAGQLVPLAATPGRPGQLSIVLSKKGRSVLVLDVVFTVATAASEERLSLPAGASGVTGARIVRASADATDIELKVTGGIVEEKSASQWTAYARGNEPMVFTWRRKTEDQPRAELPLRMRGSLIQLVGLGEDSTSLAAEVEIEVLQGAARQIKVTVPDGITINQVPGALVADWDVKQGVLVVNLLDPVDRSVKFVIAGEMRLPREGSIAVPLLRLLETERESGGVAVEVLGAGEIKDAKTQSLETVEASDLGGAVASRQSPSLAAFRLRASLAAPSLSVIVARYTQQAVLTANIEEARYRVLASADGKSLVEARYAVRNNQRNFLRVALPAGAVVWSSSLAGRPVRPGTAPDGSYLFPLAKTRAGEEAALFSVEILYLARDAAWSPKGRGTMPLPQLDLPVSRTGLVFHYPPLFRVTAEPGAFNAQPYEKPSSEAFTGAQSPPASEAAPQPSPAQALVDRYNARAGVRRATGAAPARVSFPSVGPSLFLVSELTAEGKTATVQFAYQAEKGGLR